MYDRVRLSVSLGKIVFPIWSCNPKTYNSFKDLDSIRFTQKVCHIPSHQSSATERMQHYNWASIPMNISKMQHDGIIWTQSIE